MNIYIVTVEPYHDNSVIVGAYSSRKKAIGACCRQGFIKRKDGTFKSSKHFPDDVEIAEVRVDA